MSIDLDLDGPLDGTLDRVLPGENVVLFRAPAEVAAAEADLGWTPSDDQAAGLDTLLDALRCPGFYVLAGAAGCGKTTLLRALLRRMDPRAWNVMLLAPTWRAVNVMKQVLDEEIARFNAEAVTIHRAIYGAPVIERRCPDCGEWSTGLVEPQVLRFAVDPKGSTEPRRLTPEEIAILDADAPSVGLSRYVCPHCDAALPDLSNAPERLTFQLSRPDAGPGRSVGPGATPRAMLVVVDEYSMVLPGVEADIQAALGAAPGVRILGVGDPNQLPGVSSDEEHGSDDPPDSEGTSLMRPTVALTQVHRQAAGDPILALAHPLKVYPEAVSPDWPYPHRMAGVEIRTKVGIEVPAQWAARRRLDGQDSAVVCYSNRTRAALNHAIRTASNAVAYAESHGLNLIPGDRLVARANLGIPTNGEVYGVQDLARCPESALLRADGRVQVPKPKYAHSRVLDAPLGVYRATLYRVEAPSQTVPVVLVLPLSQGRPQLESDLIRAGTHPANARRRMREIAKAWREEAQTAVDHAEKDLARMQLNAEILLITQARWDAERRLTRTELRALIGELRDCGCSPEALDTLIEDIDGGAYDRDRRGALQGLQANGGRPSDYKTALDYCVKALGLPHPGLVAALDFGEALTCHAMQGSQAEHVLVVPDGAFWYGWFNRRLDAMRWTYTAFTRASKQLAVMSLRRAG